MHVVKHWHSRHCLFKRLTKSAIYRRGFYILIQESILDSYLIQLLFRIHSTWYAWRIFCYIARAHIEIESWVREILQAIKDSKAFYIGTEPSLISQKIKLSLLKCFRVNFCAWFSNCYCCISVIASLKLFLRTRLLRHGNDSKFRGIVVIWIITIITNEWILDLHGHDHILCWDIIAYSVR